MDIKRLLKQHILTILCVVALAALLLPFLSTTAEVSSSLVGSSKSTASTSGITAIGFAFLGWGLVLGPVLLVVMNYIKSLEKYKGLLAIVVPIVCIIIEIITFFLAKSASVAASNSTGFMNMEVKTSLGIGFFVLIFVYLGMIVAGAVLFHNFTLDKAGLERLKNESANLISGLKDHEILSGAKSNTVAPASDPAVTASGGQISKTAKTSLNCNKTQEILGLIEKLATMKDQGILTEEEFSSKKQQLLEEI